MPIHIYTYMHIHILWALVISSGLGVFGIGGAGVNPGHPLAKRPHILGLLGLKDLEEQGL